MVGRFRFTPICCCVSGECVYPCVPNCTETFAGVRSDYTDRFILIDRNDFLPDCKEKKPFSITPTFNAEPGQDPYIATITENHTEGGNWKRFVVNYSLFYIEPYSVFAEMYFSAAYFVPPLTHDIDHRIGSHVFHTIVHDIEAELADYPYDYPVVHSVDSEVDDSVGAYSIHTYRIFCLPFDLEEQPFRWCDGATSIGLVSAPYKSVEDCGYTYATECNEEGLLDDSYIRLFNASYFPTALNGLTFTTDILDFYVVRLFGFTSPVCVAGMGTVNEPEDFLVCDAAGISVEFVVTTLTNKNGLRELVVCSDICVKDFPDTNQQIDWSNVVVPPGLEDYWNFTDHGDPKSPAWAYSPYQSVYKTDSSDFWGHTTNTPLYAYTNKLIPFTSCTNVPCSYTFGRLVDMPTVWRSPVKAVTPEQDTNENRFHGIYWLKAAISPCGQPFPEDVTRGILWSVPVGLFKLQGAPQTSDVWIDFQPTMFFSAVLDKDMSTFTESDWNISWLESASQAYKNLRYDDVTNWPTDDGDINNYGRKAVWGPIGGQPVECFIRKPAGKRLKELLWRVLKQDKDIYSTSTPRNGKVVHIKSDTTTDNDANGIRNMLYYGLYDMTNLDLYEVSVNGGGDSESFGFRRFTNRDTGEICYIPSFNASHMRSYIGTNEPKIYCLTAEAMRLQNASDVKIYPRLNFGYIAIWEDD